MYIVYVMLHNSSYVVENQERPGGWVCGCVKGLRRLQIT
jgi:hypothetical protein